MPTLSWREKTRKRSSRRISPYNFIKGTELESLRTMAGCSSPCGPYLDIHVCVGVLHIGCFEGTVGLLTNLSNRTTFTTP